VDLLDSTGSLIGNVFSHSLQQGQNNQAWAQNSFDITSFLSGYGGQDVTLMFTNYVPLNHNGPGAFGLDDISIDAVFSVPAPGSVALFGLGLVALSFARGKKLS